MYLVLEAVLCVARDEWHGPRKGLSGTVLRIVQEVVVIKTFHKYINHNNGRTRLKIGRAGTNSTEDMPH